LEVLVGDLAEGILDEARDSPRGGFSEGGAEEIAGAGDDVVFKPLAIEHGDDAVGVGG
jgi:hypothetical protein